MAGPRRHVSSVRCAPASNLVTLPEEIVAIRKPVWLALSDLFLDTDTRLSYAYIARTAATSPYSVEELGRILASEVAPVVQSNLDSVAGEWAGFHEEWLFESIAARLSRSGSKPIKLEEGVETDWRAVVCLVESLRRLDATGRSVRDSLWQAFCHLFLNKSARLETKHADAFQESGLTMSELDWIYRHEVWESYGLAVAAYVRHAPKYYPTRDEIEFNWADWKRKLNAAG